MVLLSPIPIRTEKILPIKLPVVDLSTERSMLTKLIVKACEEYGFFNVINHGVSYDTVAKMEEAAFDFFARPLPQKKQLPIYGCKNIGFNGDMGEIEYLLLSASPTSIAHFNNISNVPSNFRYHVLSFSLYTACFVRISSPIQEMNRVIKRDSLCFLFYFMMCVWQKDGQDLVNNKSNS